MIVEYSGPICYKTSRGVKFNSYFSTVLTFDHMYTNYIMSSTGKDTTSRTTRNPPQRGVSSRRNSYSNRNRRRSKEDNDSRRHEDEKMLGDQRYDEENKFSERRRRDDDKKSGDRRYGDEKKENQTREIQKILTIDDPKEQVKRFLLMLGDKKALESLDGYWKV